MKKILEYYYNDPETKELIADLNTVINELGYTYTKFNNIIKELTRRLYESNICEKDKISQIIKYLLLDKIKKHKISARWIEECLPRDYKRKYNSKNIDKSELTSLSRYDQETNKEEISLVQNAKSDSLENTEGKTEWIESKLKIKNPDNLKLAKLELNGCNLCRDVFAENIELKEALKKNVEFLSAQRLKNEIKVPREKYNDIISEINKNNQFLNIKFDIYGNILSIISDTPMGVTI